MSNSSLNAIGNKCFVFGGTDSKGSCYNDIRSLDVGYYLSSDDITVGEGASSDYSFKILIIGDAGEIIFISEYIRLTAGLTGNVGLRSPSLVFSMIVL